jgi:acyl carrier protein
MTDTRTLKHNLVSWLNLRNVRPEEIGDEDTLFEQGLGLDSLDFATLVGYLEKEYGIRIDTAVEGRSAFASVRALAEYIGAAARTGQFPSE